MTDLRFVKLAIAILERPDLPASAKIVHAFLRDAAGDDGKCWPGIRRIGQGCGLDKSSVLRAVSRLEVAGLIAVERRENGRSSLYRFPETGSVSRPVAKRDRSQSAAGGGRRSRPEASAKCDLNQKEGKAKRKKGRAARSPSPDGRVASFFEWFTEAYHKATGERYLIQGAKDGALIKRLLRVMSEVDLQEAAKRMLSDPWGNQHASIGLLSSQINVWRRALQGKDEEKAGYTPAQAGEDYGRVGRRFA